MKISKITGWREVFEFSFMQTLKSKIFIITTIITAVIMLCIAPLTLSNGGTIDNTTDISNVIIKDESGIKDIAYSKLSEVEENKYKEVSIETSDKELEQLEELLDTNIDYKNAVIIHIQNSDDGYSINFYKNSQSDISQTDILFFSESFTDIFSDARMIATGISDEQMVVMKAEVNTNVEVKSINEVVGTTDDKDNNSSVNSSTIAFVVPLVLFMLLVMCGENIGTSIVTEKSSKVIEYLLTSIKPLALILGKALAAVLATFIQIAVIIICSILSAVISKQMGIVGSDDILSAMGMSELFDKITVFGIITAFIIIVLGFCLFTLFACLVSSTASKIEELGETNMIYMLFVIAGLYLNMPLWTPGLTCSDAYKNAMFLVPVTSPFILPVYTLFGEANITIVIISIVILIVSLVLISLFVANVYEALIMYSGNKVKIKQLFGIFANSIKKNSNATISGDGGVENEE